MRLEIRERDRRDCESVRSCKKCALIRDSHHACELYTRKSVQERRQKACYTPSANRIRNILQADIQASQTEKEWDVPLHL
jgi:hypothetical protein